MGTFGIFTAVLCTQIALGELPERPLHEHPTLIAMLERNNELRLSVGLTPHRMSPELTQAAQDHADFMARTGQFSHYVNGGPWNRAARHGYGGTVLENIAMGYVTVDQAFTGWRGSSGHWASIISGTSEAGFGYAQGVNGVGYWVGVYGYPRQQAAKPVVEGDASSGDTEASAAAATVPATNYYFPTTGSRRYLLRPWRR